MAPLGAITPILISPAVTNKLNGHFNVIRFFFTVVPSFAVGIVTYTTNNDSGTYLALLIMTSISMGIFGLAMLCICCGICIALCAASSSNW